MKFLINVPPFGEYANPHKLAEAARTAEEAGWDGFFVWDHIVFDPTFHPIVDPWVGLSAIALSTTRIRLGTLLTPIPRRRPWKLARETVSLDHLANGRFTLGVGLGDPVQWDYGWFHEEQDAKIRAKKLDEGLEVLTGLWTGEKFSYSGEQFKLDEVIFQPRPVQQPRIPIWVGGGWNVRAPQRRAAQWDGYAPLKMGEMLTLDEWRDMMAYINQHRTVTTPFDWIHSGNTPGDDLTKAAEMVRPYADIGITWWCEPIDPWRYGWSWEEALKPEVFEQMNERIRQGPPKI